jgi:hypothetical protein
MADEIKIASATTVFSFGSHTFISQPILKCISMDTSKSMRNDCVRAKRKKTVVADAILISSAILIFWKSYSYAFFIRLLSFQIPSFN